MNNSSEITIRNNLIDHENKKVRIANLVNTIQSKDNYTNINCDGFGRIRNFRNFNLLLDNAVNNYDKSLFRGHPKTEVLRSQVFQLAGCNWKCWYCFVDDNLLSGCEHNSAFLSASEILDLYLMEQHPPNIIDLSGGQPFLVPEWIFWVLQELDRKGLSKDKYIWIDDNLSTKNLWNYLTPNQIEFMSSFPRLSIATCIKGFSKESFSFNTKTKQEHYNNQFLILKKLINSGFNIYCYATFTCKTIPKNNLKITITKFLDKLQNIHHNLPLRTIPIKIHNFSVPNSKESHKHLYQEAFKNQFIIYDEWHNQLSQRFNIDLEKYNYEEILLN